MLLATDLSARLENQEEWRNEEKAKEETRTSKEVQQEQEVVACAALVFAASSVAPFFRGSSKETSRFYVIDSPTRDKIMIGYNYRQHL